MTGDIEGRERAISQVLHASECAGTTFPFATSNCNSYRYSNINIYVKISIYILILDINIIYDVQHLDLCRNINIYEYLNIIYYYYY